MRGEIENTRKKLEYGGKLIMNEERVLRNGTDFESIALFLFAETRGFFAHSINNATTCRMFDAFADDV